MNWKRKLEEQISEKSGEITETIKEMCKVNINETTSINKAMSEVNKDEIISAIKENNKSNANQITKEVEQICRVGLDAITRDMEKMYETNRKEIVHTTEVLASLYNALLHKISEQNKEVHDNYLQEGGSDYSLSKKLIANKWAIVDKYYTEAENLTCDICGCSFRNIDANRYEAEDIYGGGMLRRWECPECGVIFGPGKMLDLTEDELGEEYMLHYSIYSEGDSTQKELRCFELLNPQKAKVYLDYGCGAWSETINELRERGYNVWGFDPYAPATNKYIINDFKKLSEMKFDGIFSHDLMEHLRYPVAAFNMFYQLLSDDGVMVHSTGCYRYVYEYTRFHLFFYTGKSNETLCKKTGFKIIDSYENPDELTYCYVYRKDKM